MELEEIIISVKSYLVVRFNIFLLIVSESAVSNEKFLPDSSWGFNCIFILVEHFPEHLNFSFVFLAKVDAVDYAGKKSAEMGNVADWKVQKYCKNPHCEENQRNHNVSWKREEGKEYNHKF